MYSTREDVLFYGRFSTSNLGNFGYGGEEAIIKAINAADAKIEEYCGVPEDFFENGGIAIEDEYHDGIEVGSYGPYPSFGLMGYKHRPKLRFKYVPVLNVKRVEEETSAGTWTTRTEGSASDYILDREKDGVRWIANVPSYDYYNVRVGYIAGYEKTPQTVVEVSGRLAATLVQQILDVENRRKISSGDLTEEPPDVRLDSPIFGDELKNMLANYRLKVPVEVQW